MGDTNGALNAYTPGAILDLIRLPRSGDAQRSALVELGSDEFCDMLLSGLWFLTREGAELARKTLLAAYEKPPGADGVIVTLWYTDFWFDRTSGNYVNRSPGGSLRLARNHGDRFEFLNASPELARQTVNEIIHEISRLTDKRAKIVLTVSPVPLHGTFTNKDSILANQYSKSALVAAAVYSASKYDFVDYFPSYEIVTNIGRNAFQEDGVHVRREVVDQITGKFSELYFSTAAAAA